MRRAAPLYPLAQRRSAASCYRLALVVFRSIGAPSAHHRRNGAPPPPRWLECKKSFCSHFFKKCSTTLPAKPKNIHPRDILSLLKDVLSTVIYGLYG